MPFIRSIQFAAIVLLFFGGSVQAKQISAEISSTSFGEGSDVQDLEAQCRQLYQSASKRALEICSDALRKNPSEAPNYQRMGQIHFRKRDYRSAHDYFSKALAIAKEKASNPDMALAINGQARILRAQGKRQAAIREFQNSLDHCDQDPKCLAGNLEALGYLTLKNKQFDLAHSSFTHCKDEAGSIANHKLLASCQYGLATADFQRGKFTAAFDWCKQAFSLYKLAGNKRGMAASLGCLTSSSRKLNAPKDEWCGYKRQRAALYQQIGDYRKSANLLGSLKQNNCPTR